MSENAESFEQVIDSLATGARLVSSLTVELPQVALTNIQKMLMSLEKHPPTPDIYLDVLEQLRHPLNTVTTELARLYRDKPLPLTEHRESVFLQVTAVLHKMSRGYGYCAQFIKGAPRDSQDTEFTYYLALALHRSLRYASAFVHEHYYARQELPHGIWQEIHRDYHAAELNDLTGKPVMDALDSEQSASTCADLYVALLLVEMANPYSHNAVDQALIHQWAMLWAPLVSIFPVESVLEIPPFIIDLTQDKPLHPATNSVASDNARHLDVFGLSARINETRETLTNQPDSVEVKTLKLGESSVEHACRLLAKLAAPWGMSASPRRFRRYSMHGQVKLCSTFEHIHLAISGKDFKQPGAFEAMHVPDSSILGRGFDIVHPSLTTGKWRPHPVSALPSSEWDVANYSTNGFRLFRDLAGSQIAHGQLLLALSQDNQDNTSPYLLGEARWLMQDSYESCLVLGVTLFPGTPEAIAVRPEDLLQGSEEVYLRAFMLPALETTKTPSTLILPIGLYRPQRSLKLAQGSEIFLVTLGHVWQRGLDFEIITYKKR
ncbi:MAG: hypothetical protein LBU53_00080 [Zoogloeaceae bacterium]|jgi:hypothetical protein|nr:hypothetical protein [Zoogloeaceae bacterium]